LRSCVGIEDEWGEQQWYFLDPLEDEREREIVEREIGLWGNWSWLGEEEERVQAKEVQGGVLEAWDRRPEDETSHPLIRSLSPLLPVGPMPFAGPTQRFGHPSPLL
jgi:hypothetical protein